MSKNNIIIFTDLDGCLLDHNNYSFTLARPLLSRLKNHGIPLIINSSKTHIEVKKIQKKIGIQTPYIIENGAAIIFNSSEKSNFFQVDDSLTQLDSKTMKTFSINRKELLAITNEIKNNHELDYQGFSEMSIETISELTQLTNEQAYDASQRSFSEPILWNDSQARLNLFKKHLDEKGIKIQAGGRFLHLSSGCNKGVAMQWLINKWRYKDTQNNFVIALGDSLNDKSMLDNSDYAIVIKNQNTELKPQGKIKTIFSNQKGTAGWVETLTPLINQLQSEQG
ncbi:MAG: HAD-IIB family hydrolase [gamma proteobacterium symbiont of Bathyaustriella thionipta]|nr:HAD-IIB family hydrolase [gamma proteobacterium symbiont of Bathyaustriella thionipta]MCU7950382.1 HAD-IIB family hydrolase [gamma proteobacterium symbiont of Bathyaustriella thionipta]MCU7955002.1 HAD-IIB family hydrolase [gamma proteobacterium symbiont of Bathyaustriella thionipta]MCU7956891.1 HAD-IIB family hydrolase [gamma proteobacterium symbiont of Bathyaustriella thionipta]MCU7965677.1 HAD-IIB family hydrolase [gamma proteobacterium symbiont of Bathyaustriella thionipta]